jgi:glycosyltransferase involved in cell wall biosynthesis
MSQRAVEYAQDYAWEKIAKQIEDVYKGLVAEKQQVLN